MSAPQSNLSPQQFPIYEVGDPEYHAPERGYHSTRYGAEHEVHPTERFGMARAEPTGTYSPTSESVLHDVPIEHVAVEQEYVYEPHVRNLATLPRGVAHGDAADHPVQGVRQGDRVIVHSGTHRTTAALLRGDSTVPIHITGEYR
jgi:hypothetical protein